MLPLPNPENSTTLAGAQHCREQARIKVLVTGGAGFIGQHLVPALLDKNYEVTIFDNFSDQVHGGVKEILAPWAHKVRVVKGDVRDADAFKECLAHQDIVVHLAAETGTGQSMYEITKYTDVNINGTAHLVDFLMSAPATINEVKKVIFASSRAVYGEGGYLCVDHGRILAVSRNVHDLEQRNYEPLCPVCNTPAQDDHHQGRRRMAAAGAGSERAHAEHAPSDGELRATSRNERAFDMRESS